MPTSTFDGGLRPRGSRAKPINPVTQAAKIKRYRQKKIGIPENLVFIPIDFDRESLPERLAQAGFEKGLSCLFILEGLTMYLQRESVDSTLRIINEFAGDASRIVFDHIYASVLRQEGLYAGKQALYTGVKNAGERFHFGIEKGGIHEFLSKHGLVAEKIMDADALDEMYFRDAGGGLVGQVSKTHCIVTAVKKGD